MYHVVISDTSEPALRRPASKLRRGTLHRSLVSPPEVEELGPMLLLTINRKPCMGNAMTLSHLTLSDLERSKPRSLGVQSLISRIGTKLRPILLLRINRKPYMGNPMAPTHLTLSDLETSISRSPRFRSLISRKGA